ncbi:hypothetical protein ACLB2K_027856 [Fragaria x ananassa]
MILANSSRQFSTVHSPSPPPLPLRLSAPESSPSPPPLSPAASPISNASPPLSPSPPRPPSTTESSRPPLTSSKPLPISASRSKWRYSPAPAGFSRRTTRLRSPSPISASRRSSLGRRFPSIPLVAEEDSASVRANNLVESVVNAVVEKAGAGEEPLTAEDVLEAIDRGGPEAFTFGAQPATYWLLDPIDGTRGFVMGNKALFVESNKCISGVQEEKSIPFGTGLLMVSHIGCGTSTRSLSSVINGTPKAPYSWTRCFVDDCSIMPEACFCITESEAWEALPPASLFTSTTNAESVGQDQVLILKPCCGSLCKYLLVASGRGSVFIQRQKDKVSKAWDHAAGIICVLEAGGTATDWEGNQVDLAADVVGRRTIYPQGGFLVSNGRIHNQLLELISSTSSTVSACRI